MRLCHSILALAALVLVAPAADAQNKLSKGKGNGAGHSSPSPKRNEGPAKPREDKAVKPTEVILRAPQRVEPRRESSYGGGDKLGRGKPREEKTVKTTDVLHRAPERVESRYTDHDKLDRGKGNENKDRRHEARDNRSGGSNDAKVVRGSMRQPQTRPNYDSYNNPYRYQQRDNCYPHYVTSYYSGAYVSPWSGYGHFPGYIRGDRCNASITVSFGWGLGFRYCWSSGQDDYRWDDRWERDWRLDRAMDGIRDAFERRDAREIGSLLSRYGRVTVEVDGRSRYSVSGDDFYDMMRDVIEGTATESYRVVDSYRHGNDATVVADHTFYNTWGEYRTQRHWYGLRRHGTSYEIVSFRTTR